MMVAAPVDPLGFGLGGYDLAHLQRPIGTSSTAPPMD
jgi:hypothetical protein